MGCLTALATAVIEDRAEFVAEALRLVKTATRTE